MRRNLRKTAWSVVLATAVLPACAPYATNGDGAADLALTVSPAQVAPGGNVTLTLENRSDAPAGYNLCAAALDRRVDGEWQPHPEPPAEACTMELRVLEPGATGTFEHTLPRALPAGEYRFRTGVEWPVGEGQVGVASDAVRVAP